MRRAALLLVCVAVLAAGCGKSSRASGGKLVIAIDVPVTGSPYVAQTIRQGVALAANNLNSGGGVIVGSHSYHLSLKLYDNHLSARQSVEDTRRALDAGAVAIVTDGTGIDATWQLANRDHVPICITYDGGTGLVDSTTRPNVFRIAPTNHGIAFRFAEYLIPKGFKVGLLHDDSAYGQEGAADVSRAFSENPRSVAMSATPTAATGMSSRTSSASTTTIPRLLGQRAVRPTAHGRRGAKSSHSPMAAKTPAKAERRMTSSAVGVMAEARRSASPYTPTVARPAPLVSRFRSSQAFAATSERTPESKGH